MRPSQSETRGSGSDRNSDSRRLSNRDNLQDKIEEDTFPASDPPSSSPIVGIGGPEKESVSDFKNDPRAQFEYGRRSQISTQRYDRSSRRLERGNPDVGEIDLGNIEADRPAEPDDNDHYD